MFHSMMRDDYDPFESILPSLLLNSYVPQPPRVRLNVIRPASIKEKRAVSTADSTNKFKVMLNVNHFKPDEVDVKTVDNFVVIHGKHEEQADQHGFVTREFTRRYQLPDDVEPSAVVSSLSRDGILTIHAPRKSLKPPKNERIVRITIQQPATVEETQKQQEQVAQQQQSEKQAKPMEE